jgi:phosphoribosylformylglycinamidine cyclo-ligase
MAGFAVGVVDRDEIIDGSSVAVGSALVGLASSGLHSNGFSLVRKLLLEDHKLDVADHVDELGGTLGEVVLTPTLIYTEAVLNVRRDFSLHGVAHITGGGLVENVPRVLPQSCKAVIRMGSWPVPPIFTYLKELGGLSEAEMVRTFNNGVGMVLVVPGDQAEDVVGRVNSMGHESFIIGEVAGRNPDQAAVEFVG